MGGMNTDYKDYNIIPTGRNTRYPSKIKRAIKNKPCGSGSVYYYLNDGSKAFLTIALGKYNDIKKSFTLCIEIPPKLNANNAKFFYEIHETKDGKFMVLS